MLGIDLSNKGLKHIPKGLDRYPITSLDLSLNSITKIRNLPKTLTHLDISGNCIQHLPNDLLKCKSLEVLVLSDNFIIEIPEWIDQFPDLKSLDILDNHASDKLVIPKQFGNLNLDELFIEHENVDDVEPLYYALSSIKTI